MRPTSDKIAQDGPGARGDEHSNHESRRSRDQVHDDGVFPQRLRLDRRKAEVRARAARTSRRERFAACVIQIEGHASAVGSEALNQLLSMQRAYAVAAVLSQNGIAPTQMLVPATMGVSSQVAANTTSRGTVGEPQSCRHRTPEQRDRREQHGESGRHKLSNVSHGRRAGTRTRMKRREHDATNRSCDCGGVDRGDVRHRRGADADRT